MDKRQAERVKVCRKVALQWSSQDGRVEEEPALSRNISVSGVCLNTRRALEPGTHIQVRIPTDGCPPEWRLPKEIEGTAEVKRVVRNQGGLRQVALAFEPCLQKSMEFGYFMAYLLDRSSTSNANAAFA